MILLHIEHPAKNLFFPNFYTNQIRGTYLNHSSVSESPVVTGQNFLHVFVFSFNMQKKTTRFLISSSFIPVLIHEIFQYFTIRLTAG